MDFAIDHGVPIPPHPPRADRVAQSRYPWRSMKPGDSFFVPTGEGYPGRAALQTAASHQRKRRGWTCTVREVPGGCRVWRTA